MVVHTCCRKKLRAMLLSHIVRLTTESLPLQAEAARRVQLQVNDLQEQLRTQESATDEAVEARRKGEACVEVMSKTFREPDALVASAKVSPHSVWANICSCFQCNGAYWVFPGDFHTAQRMPVVNSWSPAFMASDTEDIYPS